MGVDATEGWDAATIRVARLLLWTSLLGRRFY